MTPKTNSISERIAELAREACGELYHAYDTCPSPDPAFCDACKNSVLILRRILRTFGIEMLEKAMMKADEYVRKPFTEPAALAMMLVLDIESLIEELKK